MRGRWREVGRRASRRQKRADQKTYHNIVEDLYGVIEDRGIVFNGGREAWRSLGGSSNFCGTYPTC